MVRKLIGFSLALGLFAQLAPAQNGSTPQTGAVTDSTPISTTEIRAVLDQVQTLIRAQAQQLESQRQRIERQQIAIEELRREVAAGRPNNVTNHEQEQAQEQAAAFTAAQSNSEAHALNAAAIPVSDPTPQTAAPVAKTPQAAVVKSPDSPLSIHFGNASLTPGGWVDFTAIYRSTDVGSGLGTSFASIPFNNTVQGGLSETRFTAQSSRITLRADENFGATKVFAYAEADFNGYLPSNAYVSTNSDTLRLRVFFTDLSRKRWELLGGQSWSLLTPNRVGVSPFLSEIYNTLHLDTNYQVGLTYARQTQLRAVYHFTDNVALGLSAENPEQFSGSSATFPTLFSNIETDVNSGTGSGGGTATPNLHPDVVAKLSADPDWWHHKWHFETAGLLTSVAILTPASVAKITSFKDDREGGGISGVANLEVVKNLHLILTGYWSDGGGRYIGGLGPGFVVAQNGSKTAPFTAQLVHSGSGIAAVEWQATKSSVLSATYSGAYFDRVFSTDPSTGTLVGYGYQGSANTNNRAIQEGTFATLTTLWKRAGYGAVQAITQSSYITRAPWYVAPNAPKDAHVFAGYASLRYILP
jgi:TolA-binding protein